MEFFNKAKVVRIRSHLGKFLVADEDEETVKQSRDGSSNGARWTVEPVDGRSHVVRLKSCHGKYLAPSDEPFLLGLTGKKVVQHIPATKRDRSMDWEPIREGEYVKLRGKGGKFLRANWGTPPWRNSVTYDTPNRTATQDWVLWGVDVIAFFGADRMPESASPVNPSSLLPASEHRAGVEKQMELTVASETSVHASGRHSGMEFFKKAKAVRLRSHHGKYLVADEDEETVRQSRNGSSRKARWAVEITESNRNTIRLKSCHGLYLTATDEPFFLGVTGRKVQQHQPPTKSDSSTEWEPIRDGESHVKLRTREGKLLRANGGTPPWRNSVTHDVPHRTVTQDWVLWEVEVVDIVMSEFESLPSIVSVASSFSSSPDDFSGSPDTGSPVANSDLPGHSSLRELSDSVGSSPAKSEGRTIHYSVVDDNGKADHGIAGNSFQFKGHGLEELTQKLEEETGLEDIMVCSRNPLNGKLYPLRLALPPNNAAMHVVVVPSSI